MQRADQQPGHDLVDTPAAARVVDVVANAMAVLMAMVSRENRLSSMPGRPCVTPSHIAGTPPATCAVAPRRRASSRISAG